MLFSNQHKFLKWTNTDIYVDICISHSYPQLCLVGGKFICDWIIQITFQVINAQKVQDEEK